MNKVKRKCQQNLKLPKPYLKGYVMTKRIILAVSGSISAYKAADLTSRLKKKVMMFTSL